MHNHGSITDCADNVPSILFININSRGVCAEPSGEHIAARNGAYAGGHSAVVAPYRRSR